MKFLIKEKIDAWFILIGIGVLVSIYLIIPTIIDLYKYVKLDERTIAKVYKWQIVEKKSKFFIISSYNFQVGGKNYSGRYVFEEKYINIFLAREKINQIREGAVFVWYNSKNVSTSSLEKRFPLNNLIRFLISLCILFYFLFLKKKFTKENC